MVYLKRSPEIAVFLAIWVGYFALLTLMPLESAYSGLGIAVAYQILFVVVVAIGAAPSLWIATERPEMEPGYVSQLATIAVALSFIGLTCSLYDKLVIQGIDYSDGLALARERLSVAGQSRAGISSIFSVLGHLLSYSFFVAAAAVIVFPTKLRVQIVTLVACVVLLAAASVLNASRSIIMLSAVAVPSFLCVRISLGYPVHRPNVKVAVAIAILMAAAGWFFVHIFMARATIHGLDGYQYLTNMLAHLGAKLTPSGAELLEERNLLSFIVTAIAYVVHSAYTFAGITSLPEVDGHVLFFHGLKLLAKGGLIDQPNSAWVLAGRFPSLPGGLFNDFGAKGVLIGGLTLGFASYLARLLLRRAPNSILSVGVASGIMVSLFLSPLLLAADFLAFPFVAFSFAAVPVIRLMWQCLISARSG